MIKQIKNPESKANEKHIDAGDYLEESHIENVDEIVGDLDIKAKKPNRIIKTLRSLFPFKKKKHNPVRVKAGVGHIHVDITAHRQTEDPEIELLNLADMFISRWSEKLVPNNKKKDAGIR